jgi:hypothetical protein
VKFDMSRAWEQAAAVLGNNRRMVAVVAGVFFFLPVTALLLMLPDFSQNPAFATAAGDPQAMSEMINAVLQEIWWVLLIAVLLQIVGMLALYRLLSDRSRPTVGEALGFGAKALLPYVGATLLVQIIQMLLVGLPTRLTEGSAIGGVVAVAGLVVTLWLTVRFLLVGPVVAIEQQFNPFKVLQRAWHMTSGQAARLLAFFILLIAAFVVLWLVAALLFTLVFGLMGPEASRFGFALVTGAAMASYFAIYVGVQLSIHRQLSGVDQPPAGPVF